MGPVCGKQNCVVTERELNMEYSSAKDCDRILKLYILIGDPNTGKSCLMKKYFEDTFDSEYVQTIGVEFASGNLSVRDVTVKIQVWDTAGHERFRSITSAYYRGTAGVVVFYDVTNLETFEKLTMWHDQVTQYADSDPVIVIAGNKTDVAGRVVSEEKAGEFAESINSQYIETSCKDGTNVRELFTGLVDAILSRTAHEGNILRNIQCTNYNKDFGFSKNIKRLPSKNQSGDEKVWEDTSTASTIPSKLEKKSAHYYTKAENFDVLFKLLLVGDPQSGKSSLLSQFSQQSFSPSYQPTIGVDFTVSTGSVGDACVKLQIWDLAGQERFRNITQSYYRGAQGIVLMYDVTDSDTFHNLTKWLSDIKQSAPENVTVIIVGNKCDMVERAVTIDEAQQFANSENASYVEVSSKEGTNVNKLFTTMTTSLLEKGGKEVPGRAWWKTPDAGWH